MNIFALVPFVIKDFIRKRAIYGENIKEIFRERALKLEEARQRRKVV